jgi:hypothetical protein
MYKHVGKHNDKKVVILFRVIPDEEHMCLVAYSDLLPRLYHDVVMKVLESPVGQQADNLSDALFRSLMHDGRNCLEALHKDGLMKKVPTNQILVTPTNNSSVRLDELNSILSEMAKGEDAVKRLKDLDSNTGMTGKKRTQDVREVGVPTNSRSTPAPITASLTEALSDEDLARDRINQAAVMKKNAESMMQEADRLLLEAAALFPETKKNVRSTKKKTQVEAKKD